eukprot:6851695-Heterocapsa_arctica.AAC.1
MSPSWLVVMNPRKVSNFARDGGYSLALQVSIQHACDAVAILAPSERVKCKHPASWPREACPYTPSQLPPPVQIQECNQAFPWVQTTLAALPPPEGWTTDNTLPSNMVAGAIFGDWGVNAIGQIPILGQWLENHIIESV